MSMPMRIDLLWEKLASKLPTTTVMDTGNELIRPPKGSVRVCVGDYGSGVDNQFRRRRSDTFSDVVAVSRHFVKKPIYTIEAAYIVDDTETTFVLKTTADHTCCRHDAATGALEFVSASQLESGDILPFYEPYDEEMATFDGETAEFGNRHWYSCDGIAKVKSVSVDENKDGSWVYDLEVASGRHVYYANRLLVHNSQFIDISPLTKAVCGRHGLPSDTRLSALPCEMQEEVFAAANELCRKVNVNVEKLVNAACHTLHGDVLHYALEYIAAEGFYFKKKMYIVHKILEEGKRCDKFKYSGVSVKKAEIPAEMKSFLKDVYENTMTKDWTEKDYCRSVRKAYDEFLKMDWEQLSFYRKLRTPKEAISEFETEKGAGAHARGANLYNALIRRLGLGGKYNEIKVGDEMRYCYVNPSNKYGIDVISFKDKFPDEFREIMSVNYGKMFEKIFTSSLKNYVLAMGYATENPSKRTEDPDFEIF